MRFENGASAVTLILDFSREMVNASPRFPVLPLTLIRSLKNFSKSATVKMLSSTGCWQSTVNLSMAFLVFCTPFLVFRPFDHHGLRRLASLFRYALGLGCFT